MRLVLPCFLLLLFSACHAQGKNDANVLLICIDVLRADHVGAYGYRAGTTPELDRLARSGVVFDQAFSPASWTRPAVPSYMTGRFPHQHGVLLGLRLEYGRQVSDVLAERETTLAEVFQAHGYRTVAVVANPTIGAATGLGQGFDRYAELEADQRARAVRQEFLGWLDSTPVRKPFFAYLHFNDVHLPYDPPPDYRPAVTGRRSDLDFSSASWRLLKRRIRDGSLQLSGEDRQAMIELYDGELRYVDAQIGLTLAALRERGFFDRTLVVVLSDHGEELLDHGGIDHGTTLYDELVRVPLMMRFPSGEHAGLRVAEPVSTVDLFPTLAGHFGFSTPDGLSGRSLLGSIGGGSTNGTAAGERPIYSEGVHPAGYQQAIRVGDWKYISTTTAGHHDQVRPDLLEGVTEGTRIEVTGATGAAGEFVADKLEIRPLESVARDEITGAIEGSDPKTGTMHVLGYEVHLEPDCRFERAGGVAAGRDAVEAGAFVKVYGRATSPATFAATRITLQDPALPKAYQLEGRISAPPRRISGNEAELALAERVVRVSEDTRISVAGKLTEPPPASAAAGATAPAHEAPQREELFDLANDVHERVNLAATQPEQLERMRSLLDTLRQSTPGQAAPTRGVAERDLEAMRALGYVE